VNASVSRWHSRLKWAAFGLQRESADCKLLKEKAGDGDRTRDVQLGKMDAVCLSKTSTFTAFMETYGVAPELQNCRDFVS
jgi:hypothetical protein